MVLLLIKGPIIGKEAKYQYLQNTNFPEKPGLPLVNVSDSFLKILKN